MLELQQKPSETDQRRRTGNSTNPQEEAGRDGEDKEGDSGGRSCVPTTEPSYLQQLRPHFVVRFQPANPGWRAGRRAVLEQTEEDGVKR